MHRRVLAVMLAACLQLACGSDSSSPTAPTPPAATLQSVALSANPGFPSLKNKGETSQLTATGTFTNGTTQNLTSTCTVWASDNVTVATVSGSGLVTAQGSGAAVIATTCQGITTRGTATIALTAPVVTVAGVVLDDATSAPIGGATVSAAGRTSGTDGNGYYSLAGVSGAITVTATASGYVTGTAALSPATDTRQDFRLRRVVPAAPNVEYRITGDARRCSATYENSTGGTNQAEVNIPFSYSWNGARVGDFLYMSCQISTGGDQGSITVGIYKNGALYRSATASRFPNIATASGTY